uniref:Uncharacterized protein n=1 Tax=Aegilops tauschii subsp. strangulata TaxID=200361 RepID=A0A452Y8N1_AEGTS
HSCNYQSIQLLLFRCYLQIYYLCDKVGWVLWPLSLEISKIERSIYGFMPLMFRYCTYKFLDIHWTMT